jgi:hypothetical protein
MTCNSIDEAQLMKDMLYRVRAINQVPDEVRRTALDFTVDGVKLGKVCVDGCRNASKRFVSVSVDLKHLSL